MHGITDYGDLIADTVRMGAFTTALKRVIKPGAIVVDLGTGTGIWALIACALGARKVYAIESNDAIEVARTIAAANGFSDRIEFHHAASADVTLPERGDVLVADLAGMLPWFHRGVPSIIDARRRMLAPNGLLIPQRDVVWTAVVEAGDMYSRHTRAWRGVEFGFDMEAARHLAVNTWTRGRITSEQLLAPPQRWCALDYRTIEDADAHGAMEWIANRGGVGHGLAVGFDRILGESIEISNAPDRPVGVRPALVSEPVFFPWIEPVAIENGDVITVDFSGVLVRDDYVWSWKTNIRTSSGDSKAAFNQSTFYAMPLSRTALTKRSSTYVPSLSEEGGMMLLVLTLVAERQPANEIATRLAHSFPTRFAKPEDALAFVSDALARYG